MALAVYFTMPMAACSKKPIQIGRENPEAEIQQCIKLSDKKKFKDAIDCLELFKTRFPKSQWGIESELMIGDNYFRQKEYLLAADSYQAFIKIHPMHPKVDYAYYKTGLSYLKYSPKAIARDQEYLEPSISNFEIVKTNFPDSTYSELNQNYLTEARKKIAERNFYVGRFYFKTGEYIAAIPRFLEIANNYKDSGMGAEALYYAGTANIRLKKLENAKENFSKLSLEYPNSKYTKYLERELLSAVK